MSIVAEPGDTARTSAYNGLEEGTMMRTITWMLCSMAIAACGARS